MRQEHLIREITGSMETQASRSIKEGEVCRRGIEAFGLSHGLFQRPHFALSPCTSSPVLLVAGVESRQAYWEVSFGEAVRDSARLGKYRLELCVVLREARTRGNNGFE